MKNVLEKASALAEAIRLSDIYTAMVAAENALRADQEAAAAEREYAAAEAEMSRVLRESPDDPASLSRASARYIAADQAVQANPLIAAFRQRRAAFDDLLSSVNQVIAETVNLGSADALPTLSRCAGCAGCSGK